MNIKQKVEKILDKYGDASSCGFLGFSTEPYVDKIDLLYRKEMKKEIKGMKEGKIDIVKLKAEGIVDLQSWAEGYDQALQDVLDLISHKKLYEKKTT